MTQLDEDVAAREIVACPDCIANRGEECRAHDGAPCEQHPSRRDAAARLLAEVDAGTAPQSGRDAVEAHARRIGALEAELPEDGGDDGA